MVEVADRVSYTSVELIADDARPYPAHLLEGLATGVCLFGAAYLGHNDAVHFWEHGLATQVVDVDFDRMAQMRRLYPDDWNFVVMDAWQYAEGCVANEIAFDAVSVDCYTGDAEQRALETLELWTELANELVTVTIATGSRFTVPKGWRSGHMRRGYRASWLILRRDRD